YLTYGPEAEELSKIDRATYEPRPHVFRTAQEAELSYEGNVVKLHDIAEFRPYGREGGHVLTTIGRIIYNDRIERALAEALGDEFDASKYVFVNQSMKKRDTTRLIDMLVQSYGATTISLVLDAFKDLGFKYATQAGITISKNDVVVPPSKQSILDKFDEIVGDITSQYDDGLITQEERHEAVVEQWNAATDEVAEAMIENLDTLNPIFMMANSGARGSFKQIRQLAGMRGLMANPKGEIIERPIKANFMEGLSVLEYFISTHGARKGLADTALRTADSGYLTRRLVDVAQDVIVREEDCGTDRSLPMRIAEKDAEGHLRKLPNIENTGTGRTVAEDIEIDGVVLAKTGEDTTELMLDRLTEAGVEAIRTSSVLVCEAKIGVCGKCYGRSLATGKRVDVGEAVGIVAAQSIGEPGTQLTMRTSHTGGVAGQDITHGLPRIQELFEARIPKGMAPISEYEGRVKIEETEKTRKIIVVPDDGAEEVPYQVPMRSRLLVADGGHVAVGDQLIAGAVNPHEVLRILGSREVQKHLVAEVQNVYRSQGVSIHDKHIEIIIRQMLKRVNVLESGDADLLPGELVERPRFEEVNRAMVADG